MEPGRASSARLRPRGHRVPRVPTHLTSSELVCTSNTSTGNGSGSTTDPVQAWNPHLKFYNDNRGARTAAKGVACHKGYRTTTAGRTASAGRPAAGLQSAVAGHYLVLSGPT
ncbi:hypothetical protein DAD99_03585 [Pseudarthrobacter sp. AB1]|nr:hypothetical protein [Pseudarthrobacter sp. AB1]